MTDTKTDAYLICNECDHSIDAVQEAFGTTYVCGNQLCGRIYLDVSNALDESEAVIAALVDALRPFDRAIRYSEELNYINKGGEPCRPHDMVCSFEFNAARAAIAKADARKK